MRARCTPGALIDSTQPIHAPTRTQPQTQKQSLNHLHIVKLFHVFRTPDTIYIVQARALPFPAPRSTDRSRPWAPCVQIDA